MPDREDAVAHDQTPIAEVSAPCLTRSDVITLGALIDGYLQ